MAEINFDLPDEYTCKSCGETANGMTVARGIVYTCPRCRNRWSNFEETGEVITIKEEK